MNYIKIYIKNFNETFFRLNKLEWLQFFRLFTIILNFRKLFDRFWLKNINRFFSSIYHIILFQFFKIILFGLNYFGIIEYKCFSKNYNISLGFIVNLFYTISAISITKMIIKDDSCSGFLAIFGYIFVFLFLSILISIPI